jgi:hypothetical protein
MMDGLLGQRKAREAALGFHLSLAANHTPLPFLIANETHSREKPSTCKQSACKILIANEFQLQNAQKKLPADPGSTSNRHKFAFYNLGAESFNRTSETPNCRSKLLDFELTYSKHSTSHFLIDDFQASFGLALLPAPPLFLTNSNRADRIHSPFCFTGKANLRERGE